MPEIYQYIASIGKDRPGTLEELSILSHSWAGGPILFDTTEAPEFDTRARQTERDPADRDAPRSWKDFSPVNMPFKANFVAAFSGSPFIRVLGLSRDDTFTQRDPARHLCQERHSRARHQARGPHRLRSLSPVVFPDNRPGIIQYIQQWLFRTNYMAFLAVATGRTVEGGAPGMETLFTPGDATGVAMFVARKISAE